MAPSAAVCLYTGRWGAPTSSLMVIHDTNQLEQLDFAHFVSILRLDCAPTASTEHRLLRWYGVGDHLCCFALLVACDVAGQSKCWGMKRMSPKVCAAEMQQPHPVVSSLHRSSVLRVPLCSSALLTGRMPHWPTHCVFAVRFKGGRAGGDALRSARMPSNLASLFESFGIDADSPREDAAPESPVELTDPTPEAEAGVGSDTGAWSDAGTPPSPVLVKPPSPPADTPPGHAAEPPPVSAAEQRPERPEEGVVHPDSPRGRMACPSTAGDLSCPDPFPLSDPAAPVEKPLPPLPAQRTVSVELTNLRGHPLHPLSYTVRTPRVFGCVSVFVEGRRLSDATTLWFDAESSVLRDEHGVGGKLRKGCGAALAALYELASSNGVMTNFQFVVEKHHREQRLAARAMEEERDRSRADLVRRRCGRTSPHRRESTSPPRSSVPAFTLPYSMRHSESPPRSILRIASVDTLGNGESPTRSPFSVAFAAAPDFCESASVTSEAADAAPAAVRFRKKRPATATAPKGKQRKNLARALHGSSGHGAGKASTTPTRTYQEAF
eukprot:TRINITY_DN790_c0_g4_i1.p1 TRINITY_DN790_c0_g4~~TRINITY_DN790_c0_g4_i1.p1  ORF type:complete len:551 (+),score=42.77 TRINITY_DN790_c0_g4_i1:287-1939(+)